MDDKRNPKPTAEDRLIQQLLAPRKTEVTDDERRVAAILAERMKLPPYSSGNP